MCACVPCLGMEVMLMWVSGRELIKGSMVTGTDISTSSSLLMEVKRMGRGTSFLTTKEISPGSEFKNLSRNKNDSCDEV